jgi:hypothetical protein
MLSGRQRLSLEVFVVEGDCNAQVRLGCVFENVVGAASVVNEKSSSLQSADDCLGFDRVPI